MTAGSPGDSPPSLTQPTVDEFASAARSWVVTRPGLQVNSVENLASVVGHGLMRRARTATGRWRLLPGYLIIGAQKSGTSSLYDELASHPQVARSEIKEVDYFNWFYYEPLTWYRGFFPRRHGQRITGEASPDYLYDSRVPERVARDLPEVKIIVLLRNPVDRAISHYHHQRQRGLEGLTLEAALDAEPARLHGETERVAREPHYRSMPLRHFSYVDRGRYAEQLERWMGYIERERILIIGSERFFAEPEAVYAQTLEFLGLRPFTPPNFEPRNVINYEAADARLRERLGEAFADDNDRLFALIGERFDWRG